ncbi:MAG: hypothetical protein RMY28_013610 [Nostoc sp. ChiSLP01]|nr:hypothetical protein [Nostoc sp. CmiSLP01]MDZ8284915.1 hypothetical protein [Nostoc sp. ChiSLP01]
MSNSENELNKEEKEVDREKDRQDSESGYIEKFPEELGNLPPEIRKQITTFFLWVASLHLLFHRY